MRDNNLFTKRNDAIHRVNFKQLKSEPSKTHIRSDQSIVRIINNYGKLPSKNEQVFILTTYGSSEVNSENWKHFKYPNKGIFIQWSYPLANYNLKINWDVIKADPSEYMKRFGNELIPSEKIPSWVRELDREIGYKEYLNDEVEIEGDIEALNLVDEKVLEREGLLKYKKYVKGTVKYDIQ